MTPADLIAHRARLRMTAADLGRALRMPGRDPGAYVRKWETGVHPIPGPVSVAVELLTRRHVKALTATPSDDETASQITGELPKLDAGPIPYLADEIPPAPAPKAAKQPLALTAYHPPLKTRRRG